MAGDGSPHRGAAVAVEGVDVMQCGGTEHAVERIVCEHRLGGVADDEAQVRQPILLRRDRTDSGLMSTPITLDLGVEECKLVGAGA